jgi:hypothetical protein
MYMVFLAAIDWSIQPSPRTDEELKGWMRSGRGELVHMTGVDFGYDLVAWHYYLMANPELAGQYTFHDRDDFRFHECILAEVGNPRRAKLAQELARESD